MKNEYTHILKKHFGKCLKSERLSAKLTQAAMASILQIDVRSYIELELGRACCSGPTLALFLLYGSSDPISFLDELRLEFERNSDAVV